MPCEKMNIFSKMYFYICVGIVHCRSGVLTKYHVSLLINRRLDVAVLHASLKREENKLRSEFDLDFFGC